MAKDECATHREELTLIGNIDKNVADVKKLMKEMNGRVRKTEIESGKHGVRLDNHDKSIGNIRKIIWGAVVAIIGTLGTWVSKLMGFTGK